MSAVREVLAFVDEQLEAVQNISETQYQQGYRYALEEVREAIESVLWERGEQADDD